MIMKFYKIINSSGYVLSKDFCEAAYQILGYGGVWSKDHRKAKRFRTIKDCQNEVNKMPCRKGEQFLIVENNENWKNAFKNWRN